MAYFTGHISNFTKEVLMKEIEKEEGSPDSKRKDAEAIKVTLRSENQRLETLCSNLEQKYKTSELQIKKHTAAY